MGIVSALFLYVNTEQILKSVYWIIGTLPGLTFMSDI